MVDQESQYRPQSDPTREFLRAFAGLSRPANDRYWILLLSFLGDELLSGLISTLTGHGERNFVAHDLAFVD